MVSRRQFFVRSVTNRAGLAAAVKSHATLEGKTALAFAKANSAIYNLI
jgi:hypothetical protein